MARLIKDKYEAWKNECNERFMELKKNEEELNKIFIDLYGLQDELTYDVSDKDITVHYVVDKKEDASEELRANNYLRTKQDEIKDLISYAVGCVFGRFSLDYEGFAYAGGDWDESRYQTIIPDEDNILPISDDEFFEDDIAEKFVNFVKVVYGEETLEENLQFIADALEKKGTSREVIRSYFISDFYKDHIKMYSKRPIYWLFDSGKKNAFKALIYIHRYKPDLLARLRTDYIHNQQEIYRQQISMLEESIDSVDNKEKAKINKKLKILKEKEIELIAFEEKIHHLSDQMIEMDLDDGVAENYKLFGDVLAKIK